MAILIIGIILVSTVYYLTSVVNFATLVVFIWLHAFLSVSCKSCMNIRLLSAGQSVCSSRMPPRKRKAPQRSEGDSRRKRVRGRTADVATAADGPILDEPLGAMAGRPDHGDVPTVTTAALQEQLLQMQQHMQAMGDVITDMAAASTAMRPGVTAAAGAAATTTGTADAAPMLAVAGGEAMDHPSNMDTLSSVPLGSFVDERLRTKIWGKQFVDLGLLVGTPKSQTTLLVDPIMGTSQVQVKDQPTAKIHNIEQWTDAFMIYVAIYTQRFPNEIQDILKYMQLIRSLGTTVQPRVFLTYDSDFRKLRAINSMPWSHLHPELYHKVTSNARIATNPTFLPKRQQPFPRRQSFPTGFCFAFCSTGTCRFPRCTYRHSCPNCNGPHMPAQCPAKRQAAILPKPQTPNTSAHRPAPRFAKPK